MISFFTHLVASVVVWLRMGEIKIVGRENLPGKNAAYIVVSNHESYFDPAVIWKVTDRPIRFWMKTDIFFKYVDPLLVLLCRVLFGIIPVDRKKRGANPITESIPILETGHCVAAFPSGSRKVQDLSYKGSVQLAIDTGVPVIPMLLIGTKSAANPLDLIKRGRIPVVVLIGKPIFFSENGSTKKAQRESGLTQIAESIGRLQKIAKM